MTDGWYFWSGPVFGTFEYEGRKVGVSNMILRRKIGDDRYEYRWPTAREIEDYNSDNAW